MFVSVGEVANAGPADQDRFARRSLTPERTGEPVRRHSHTKGRCEGVFWRPTKREDVRQIVLAARRYELEGRQPGERTGPLGSVALELLELLANIVSYKTGRLDPSFDYLMAKLKRSRDAINRALKALRTHGFIDWLRRYEPTGNEGRGPQVKQTSNAYRLSMPARALRLLGRLGQKPPPADDHSHAQEQRAAELDAHRDSLPLDEQALFTLGDTPLGQAMASLARSIQQRESAKRTESLSSSIIYAESASGR